MTGRPSGRNAAFSTAHHAAKAEAVRRGETFFVGDPCRDGHQGYRLRRAKGQQCHLCVQAYQASLKAERAEKRKTWVRSKPPVRAWAPPALGDIWARAGVSYRAARKRRHYREPPGEDQDVLLGIYIRALVMSFLDRVPYEVDHIEELVDGGWHTASNLQVIPRKAHLRKTRLAARTRAAKNQLTRIAA